jgi:hypothetical protein
MKLDNHQLMENGMKAIMTTTRLIAALAILCLAGFGCSSQNKQQSKADKDADQPRQDRLLVRMALAQNVYNGIATERAVYSTDFDPGSAELNELGTRRIKTLIDAAAGGSGEIVVLRGDAADDLYTARVTTVRQQIADAGAKLERVSVVKGAMVGGGVTSSDRTVLGYNKMLASYQEKDKPQTGGFFLQPMGQQGSTNNH